MNNLSSNWFKSNTYLKLQSYCSDDVEAGKDNLEKFFEEIENVKDDMSSVEKLYKKLQEANEESKIVHNAKTMKELRSRIDSDAKRVLKRVKIIKGKLEVLERSNAANRSLPGSGPGSSVDRTRTLVVSGLGKKLKSLMDDFQGLRATMQSEYKETVKRRYFTVTGERASEETLESLISSGESESFLRNAIQEQERGPKMGADYYSERSHDDAVLKETEKSLLELHEIFLDMAALVGSQGHQMSDIESHVACASSFVRRGTEGLEEAKEYRPKNQASAKWRRLAMALAAVAIFVMLLPFLATMLPHFLRK